MSVLQVAHLEPVPQIQHLPLSFSQQRLWFLDQLEPNSPFYNIRLNLRLQGRLNLHRLEQSLTEVIRRHEVLRTNFRSVNGEPVQTIGPARALTIPLLDLSGLAKSERESQALKLTSEENGRPFRLEHDPLLRTLMLRLAAEDHILLITVHHIVFDGWSHELLRNELTTLYEAFSSDRPSPLPELPVQYADFAVWQRQYFQSSQIEKHMSYWKKQLAEVPVLEFPTDHPRPPLQSFRGMDQSRIVPMPLLSRLKQISKEEGCTLFMTLFAAFNVLLSRYSGQDDIAVGSAIAGRNRPEIEKLIGFFVNSLVLRTDLSGNPTFQQLLSRVREVAIDAYEHQDIPFERLVEELRPERNTGRNPIFQVMFTLQNMPRQNWELSGLTLELVGGSSDVAKFDLVVSLAERPDGLMAHFSYNPDLFEHATIGRMLEHFENLLHGIAANPAQPISQLPLLGVAERYQIVAEWNDTQRSYPNACIHELFELQASLTPDATALVLDDRQMSYRELNRRANQVGRQLQKLGVSPETLVGVFMERSFEMIIGFLGILKAGGAYLPLDPSLPDERLLFMINDARLPVILVRPGQVATLPDGIPRLLVDASCASEIGDDEDLKTAVNPENLVYVMYTSGSTGLPKGVEALHRGVVRLLFEGGFARIDESGVFLHFTHPTFDASTLEVWGALLHGGRCVLFPSGSFSPHSLKVVIEKHKVNNLWLTTPVFNAIIDEAPETLSGIRQVFTGGEALSVVHISRALEILPQTELFNAYGPTENTVFTSTYHIPRQLPDGSSSIPIGRPIGNTQIYVLDRYMNPVPIGVVGELYTGGDGVARGYLNRPELTSEKFVANPFNEDSRMRLYRTGDLVRYLPDGNIDFLGRVDHQVKIRGYRIELGEIESVLVKCPSVKEALVMVREDIPGLKRLVGYVVPQAYNDVNSAELRTYLKHSLPDYMVPTKFVPMRVFPLTPNGKIDRRVLPAPAVGPNDRDGPVLPRNELEDTVLRVWKRILGIDSIGVTDDFFALGGHSLQAVRLMTEIESATGTLLPVATLFEGATVEYLASALLQQSKPPSKVILAIRDGNAKPPFFGIVTPGGNALGYVALARHLSGDQPIYRIAGAGPRLRGRPYTAVEFEGLAAHYVEAMKTAQPQGPYYLGGMCEGARIAFDMARLLETRGEKVALLAIFDTWVIENSQNRLLFQIYYYSGRLKSFWRGTRQEKQQALITWARHRFGQSRPSSVWADAYWPGSGSCPARYAGNITVFKVPKQPLYRVSDPLLGWGSCTTGTVELGYLDSSHKYLLREPYVRSLAEKLADSLDRARSSAGGCGHEKLDELARSTA